MRQRIVKGRAAELRYMPPEVVTLGPPAASPAPTVEIIDRLGAVRLPAAAAASDPVSLTLSAAAAPGDRRVLLASTAGVYPGRRYLLGAAKGVRVPVKVIAVDVSGVWLDAALPVRLESGATFSGAEVTYQIPADLFDEDADLGFYRAAWTFTLGTAALAGESAFSVVRRVLAPSLEPDDLSPYLPQEMSRTVRVDEAPAHYGKIVAAWDEVLGDVEDRGVEADRIMDASRLRIAHLYKALVLIGRGWGEKWREWTDGHAETYEARLSALLASPTNWIDRDGDGVKEPAEAGTSSIRLER